MEDDDDYIYQGEFLKLSESKKRLIGSKSDTWKPKYLIARKKGDSLLIEYHKKKPKNRRSDKTLTDVFDLSLSYKVEKLKNARGRSFVCEITAPDVHIFLSADAEKDVDVFVFLLQAQIRLREDIKKDVISVIPEDTESQQRIGAKGSKCILHASPWGLTLALKSTRSLLAQWPLKSIRYYETSGRGNFNIEAGRVAPMGEGLFQFRTNPGEDDFLYDLVDSYIVNTLDRVKPAQRGTAEEIEEYIREHDSLHSLTCVCVCSPRSPAIRHVLKTNWNIHTQPSDGESVAIRSPHSARSSHSVQSVASNSTSAPTSSTCSSPSLTSARGHGTHSSSLVINLDRPGEQLDSRGNSLDSRTSRSSEDSNSTTSGRSGRHGNNAERPPPPLPPGRGGGRPRRSRRREHSIPRKVDVVTNQSEDTLRAQSSTDPSSPRLSSSGSVSSSIGRRHSNPSSVLQRVENTDSHILGGLTIDTTNIQTHSTEFYNLSSPNMKVRVSKSPVVTRNPNKVGRAEYLMSVSQSGVKSPTSPSLSSRSSVGGDQGEQQVWVARRTVTEEEHQDALQYLDAVAKASQQQYGAGSQQGSLDRRFGAGRQLSRQSSSGDPASSTESPALSRAIINGGGGYVNLQGTPLTPPRDIIHSRQRSAPEFVLDLPQNGPSLVESARSPTKHTRQWSTGGPAINAPLDVDGSVEMRPRSAGNVAHGNGSEDRSSAEREAARRQLKGYSSPEDQSRSSSSVTEWIVSASCEDLSDHMRTVIYDQSDSCDNGNAYEEIDSSPAEDSALTMTAAPLSEEDSTQRYKKSANVNINSSNNKPPLPFTGLKRFQNNAEFGRDRSQSFGYINLPQGSAPSPNSNTSSNVKPHSMAPSAHLIRKMVNARNRQETLRKSLSNPNFLNLGSKEHLFTHKTSSGGGSSGHTSGSSGKLNAGQKQKSRSFGSLIFPAIRKALSRESLGGGSRGRSVTPERRSTASDDSGGKRTSRGRSFSFRRRNSERGRSRSSSLRRRESFHGPGEMTIKGIRMTARSRSFRRVREAKSVEVLVKKENGEDVTASQEVAEVASSETNPSVVVPPDLAEVSLESKSDTPVMDTTSSAPTSELAEATLVYTTLSFDNHSSSSFPVPPTIPVPPPNIPPPLPVRRKSSELLNGQAVFSELPSDQRRPSLQRSESNYMNLTEEGCVKNIQSAAPQLVLSHDDGQEIAQSTQSNGQELPIRRSKPRVSDIIAQLEDNNNNNNSKQSPTPQARVMLTRSSASRGEPQAAVSRLSGPRGGPQVAHNNGKAKGNHQDGIKRASNMSTKSWAAPEMRTKTSDQHQASDKGEARGSAQPASNRVKSTPAPFQPIPFKKANKRITSVKPPR